MRSHSDAKMVGRARVELEKGQHKPSASCSRAGITHNYGVALAYSFDAGGLMDPSASEYLFCF
jgi:hypothetical protein